MTAKDAIDLYKLFDQHGIKIWIDDGWGVDALLGHQARKHDDLDIALHHSNLPGSLPAFGRSRLPPRAKRR
jgi:lincosamide nucleotidyltransferase A/C/D/E